MHKSMRQIPLGVNSTVTSAALWTYLKMNLCKCVVLLCLLVTVCVEAKVKLVAFKKPHAAFIGLKIRKPKLLGLKNKLGHGGGGGGHHSSYTHHESYHHHSSYNHGGGGFGGYGGWGSGLGGWFK